MTTLATYSLIEWGRRGRGHQANLEGKPGVYGNLARRNTIRSTCSSVRRASAGQGVVKSVAKRQSHQPARQAIFAIPTPGMFHTKAVENQHFRL